MAEASATMPPPQNPAPSAGNTTAPAGVDPSKTAGQRAVSAPFQISMMQDRDRWLKMLVYGGHGRGKTELLGSAVDCLQMRDVLMLDAESGDLTLNDSERIHNPDLIHHIKVENFKQVAYVQEFLRAYCTARDNPNKAAGLATMKKLYAQVTGIETDNPPIYRTIIVDSLSEIEAYCQYQVLNVDEDKVLKDDGGMDVSGWPEFRKVFEMMKLLVRSFRDLPMHVLFACAEGYTKDEVNRHHYAPLMTGKLATQVQGFVDVVGRIMVGEVTADSNGEAPRRVYIQPISGSQRFDAKNRRSSFKPAYFDNPNMTTIMKDLGLYKEELNK
jgi:hypothetical protein